jgi:hypothetical protein
LSYKVGIGSLSIVAADIREALRVFDELSKHNGKRVVIRDLAGNKVDPDYLRFALARTDQK